MSRPYSGGSTSGDIPEGPCRPGLCPASQGEVCHLGHPVNLNGPQTTRTGDPSRRRPIFVR